jgi:hypothetical protein
MALLLVTLVATGTIMGTQYVSAHGHCHHHHYGHVSAMPSGGGGMSGGGGGGGGGY